MTDPRLSIVTPSYNQGDFIEDCIRSVKTQANDDIEHIVVDGRSTDETVDILERYEDEYNLRWISEPDSGQSNAINKGIRMADGDWIGWQNSDDFYLSGAFEVFAEARRRHPDADLIYGDVLIVNEEGTEFKRLFQSRPSKFAHRYWSLFARNHSAFFSKAVFETVGDLNEELSYTMDEDFFWRILNADLQLVNLPDPIGAFRIQQEGKTQQPFEEIRRKERAQIYQQSNYEMVPRSVLETVGRVVKGLALVRDRRWEAFH